MKYSMNDYSAAIQSLKMGMKQLEPDGNSCSICQDTGHQAFECHHNPLVLIDTLKTKVRHFEQQIELNKNALHCDVCQEVSIDWQLLDNLFICENCRKKSLKESGE